MPSIYDQLEVAMNSLMALAHEPAPLAAVRAADWEVSVLHACSLLGAAGPLALRLGRHPCTVGGCSRILVWALARPCSFRLCPGHATGAADPVQIARMVSFLEATCARL